MKREVFISVFFLLELNISYAGLPQDNKLITINRPDVLNLKPVLDIKPGVFTNRNFNSQTLNEERKYYLSRANTTAQNSKNKFQVINSSAFLLEEGNWGMKILRLKKHDSRKKGTKNKSTMIKPNNNLIKVPP